MGPWAFSNVCLYSLSLISALCYLLSHFLWVYSVVLFLTSQVEHLVITFRLSSFLTNIGMGATTHFP